MFASVKAVVAPGHRLQLPISRYIEARLAPRLAPIFDSVERVARPGEVVEIPLDQAMRLRKQKILL